MSDLGSLYDKLFSFESKGKNEPYPIHKRLTLPDGKDLLDWALEKTPSISDVQQVLDAGCGSGYSLFRLALSGISGLGVSLSEKEIDFATSYCKKKNLNSKLSFQRLNYDTKFNCKFDLILAIESLKHSANLENSLNNLIHHLNIENGHLLIADDYYDNYSEFKTKQDAYWLSNNSLTHNDFILSIKNAGGLIVESFDLTERVYTRSLWLLKFLQKSISILVFFSNNESFKIYLGGILLERAYVEKMCSYKVTVIKKKSIN